jgi:predicted GIY-YIG superfamily endonuclease
MPSVPNEETPTSVYLYFDDLDVLIYVGVTSRGIRRQREHNTDKDWWQYVTRQEVRHFPTRGEALAEERRLIKKHLPPFNRVHNPGHNAARSAYFTLQAARSVSMTTPERRAVRRGLPLSVMSEPLPGHAFTLYSSAIDSAALTGELDRSRLTSAVVSTPQRLKSGRIVDARYAAGMLVIGIVGKYLPGEILRARAMVSVLKNHKPTAFEIRRILLNENDDNATRLSLKAS